jgi:hypothetical protein
MILLFFIVTPGCDLFVRENTDKPVARVLNKYLYMSDLNEVIPGTASPEDSAAIAKSFIDKWIRQQLMLSKAEEALSDEQKNVEKKIEEYRSSLLIYSYRQQLLQQKMDTEVTERQITDYYENNIDNFILANEIVKATFVKVPVSAPNISDVRNWIRSESVDDLDKLEKYCFNYAEKFDMFNNSWIYFSTLMNQIPLTIEQPRRFLIYNKNIETNDNQFHYFVHITDHKSEGETIPLELIREDITSILLNKRKIEFYKDLEIKVYNEGANRNQFEIY